MKKLKYLIITCIIIIPCIIQILIYNDKITQNSPIFYKQGVDFYTAGDYANAYYNFGKINRISPLYEMALYKQAKSAQQVGDYEMASLKYKLYLDRNSNSLFADTALYNLGKCYFYLKDYESAKTTFLELKNRENHKPLGEDYYLGMIEKTTDKIKAAEYFISYLKQDDIKNKNNEIAAIEEIEGIGRDLTLEEKELLGKIYYKNAKYSTSLKYLSVLPTDIVWDYLVLANHKAGNKVIAKKIFESGINEHSYKIDKDNLHEIYNIYTSYMSGKKLTNWTRMHNYILQNNLAGEDYVLYKLAQISPKVKALTLYEKITNKYPSSNYAPESLWNVFWSKYKKNRYLEAEGLAIKHLKQFKNVKSTPRIAFWLAKTEMKLNKHSEAHNILSKLANRYPDDYYGLRAEFIINKNNNFFITNNKDQIPVPKDEIMFPISLSHLNIKDLKLINTLFKMGDYEIWMDANFDNKIVESWFELRKDNKTRSCVLARNAIQEMEPKPAFISPAYKLAYPRHWVQEANIAGKKLELDPFLILSIIKEESHFNEQAKSKTNATGLMQLMPATANFMIAKLNIDIPVLSNLENPRTNIYLGCNYLNYLNERFNNDLYSVAAYNGGEGSVNKWIRIYNTKDPDEFIENIPYDETRNYIKKIFRTYHLYKKIYK